MNAPFQVRFAHDDVADLRQRLAATRWPERETVHDRSQGVPLADLRELAAYWRDEYDFDTGTQRLNRWPQFTTTIDDVSLHFVHARSAVDDALPLVLTHGWPSSVVQFLDVIGPLTDPETYGGAAADAFHVVCPSLPGHGFSGRPTSTGWGVRRTADAWATVMADLGYERYAAHGGDRGAPITTALGRQHARHVIGIHLTSPAADLRPLPEDPTLAEIAAAEDYDEHLRQGNGYFLQQSTRPQTIGYGLVDSPVGLLAWIIEKFWAWTDNGGHLFGTVTREQVLDNVNLYWFPGTGASAARMYWEEAGAGPMGANVPTACTIFPGDIRRPSRRQVARYFPNIHHWSEPARGGHLSGFEEPLRLVDELRAAFRELR